MVTRNGDRGHTTPQVLHAAVWITDPAETLAFYVDLLGLECVQHAVVDGVENYLVGGCGGAEIQFKFDPDREDPAPGGIDHIAVGVKDVDETVDCLREEGYPLTAGPMEMSETGNRVAFIEGPDRYIVELVAPIGDSSA